ncbi:MAG: hypothetical protein GXP15_00645 [Gammaproteobacteria bacterium]|nr:hypothetical protein [Gammaproteobacteria bacterium]
MAGRAGETNYELNGHTKVRLLGQSFPQGSIFRDVAGATVLDSEGDLRLNFQATNGRWSFTTDYQLIALYGDGVEHNRDLSTGIGLPVERAPRDDRRLFDLTGQLGSRGKLASLQRFDRLWVGFSGEKIVLRAGRQALTWGNGLFFSPMDIVNPFDPATIDSEYKFGDDMLYAQYLKENGDDLQLAWVARRDPISGNVESTTAVKYHRIAGDNEYDLLLARRFASTTLGIGGNRSVGGAVWRADLVLTNATDWTVELVTNVSYSWVWSGKNVSGALEYYFNGFGLTGASHDISSLSRNPDLLARLGRGQTFSIGRNYVAAGVTIELSPLWRLTPNLFVNLSDQSALLQFVTQHNLGDNLTFLAALNFSLGPQGTEYGGIGAGRPGRYISQSGGLFAQLAWYF